LAAGAGLFRIHRRTRQPWWFGADGSGRFDLTTDAARGTCYLAERDLGSFVEVFRDTPIIDERDVRARVVTVVRLPHDVVAADCTSSRARRFGVTSAIHSSEDYASTQAWAAALSRAGFDGVRYLVGHDPAARLVGLALFGPRGDPGWGHDAPQEIGGALTRSAEERFGIRVLPT
jgi:hypothetical protein